GTGLGELHLEAEYKLTSKLLARVAGSAERLVLFAMTIGNVFDARLSPYKEEGKISEAFALDAAGTAFITKASMAALSRLEEMYHKVGLNTTFPLGPGHSYWPRLEDLQIMFNLLKPERIGLHLTESNLIMPRKSVAMVMGVGRNLPESHEQTHCNFCSIRATCQLSQAGQKNLDN
ncbi:MAG: Vitamin B12 dependent methionine synthase activation subunit, partial [Desulfitobacterium hafniense]|nr:Vitamin B12 dependent methionine synthase activation subunit [Desulfitobacterium hafniense]